MQNRAILLRSWGRIVGKERGQQELESVATTPNHGRAEYRRLGLLDLSFFLLTYPSLPSLLSLPRVGEQQPEDEHSQCHGGLCWDGHSARGF